MTISRDETLRYLGWRGQELDERLSKLLDDCIAECLAIARPRSVKRIFTLSESGGGIALNGSNLILTGNSVKKHLHGAGQAILLAATLGHEVDAAVRRHSVTDMTRSLLLDAAATALIEDFCDSIERELRADVERDGLFCNFRFSPGYGDLPIELQSGFLAALDAGRAVGLTCTPACAMIPAKSVSAVLGLFREPWSPHYN